MLLAPAAVTNRIRLATLATSVAFRNPAPLAKIAAGVDMMARSLSNTRQARRSLISKVWRNYATASRWAAGVTPFPQHVLQRGVVEHSFGQHPETGGGKWVRVQSATERRERLRRAGTAAVSMAAGLRPSPSSFAKVERRSE